MVRLLIILLLCAALAGIVLILVSIWTEMARAGQRQLRRADGALRDESMASSGVQKAAYVALIVILFGTASGWLGGL